MFKDILEDLSYESRILIEDVKLGIASKEDIVKAIDNLRKIKDKVDEILRDLTTYITAYEEKELEEEETETEEETEETEEIEFERPISPTPLEKTIPFRKGVIIALSRSPKASPQLKEEAERIIEKYGLSEEEVKRITEWYYG